MTYTFKVGDRVKLNFPSEECYHNKIGTIEVIGQPSPPWKETVLTIRMDDKRSFRFRLAVYSNLVLPLEEEDDDLYI